MSAHLLCKCTLEPVLLCRKLCYYSVGNFARPLYIHPQWISIPSHQSPKLSMRKVWITLVSLPCLPTSYRRTVTLFDNKLLSYRYLVCQQATVVPLPCLPTSYRRTFTLFANKLLSYRYLVCQQATVVPLPSLPTSYRCTFTLFANKLLSYRYLV